MITPASPSRDDLTGLVGVLASFWPPSWLNLILAAIIGVVGLALYYCKHHIFIYVSIDIDNMWHVICGR